MSCSTPVSLLASITDTSAGFFASAAEKSASATRPSASTAISCTLQPRRFRSLAGSRTQGCSMAEIAIVPGDRQAAAPLMNRLLASEPLLVNTTSVGCAPAAQATTCPRAVSIARARRAAVLVAARGIAVAFRQERQHRLQHARIQRRRGVVVEVGRGEHGTALRPPPRCRAARRAGGRRSPPRRRRPWPSAGAPGRAARPRRGTRACAC